MFTFIEKLNKNQRTVLYICFYTFVCSGFVTLMMGSALPDMKAAYGLSETVSGALLSAHSIGNLASGFLSSLIPLYLGRKRSIVLLSALTFLGFGMMMAWGNPLWLFAAFLLTGMGRGSVTNFNSHRVNLLTDGSPTATNLLHASFSIGAILSPMLFLLCRGLWGWRSGMIAVVLMGCVCVWLFSRMRLTDDHPDRKDKTQSTLCFLKNPSFLILAMMMLTYLCSEYTINGWLVTYIQNKEELIATFGKNGTELEQALASYSQLMATLFWCVMLAGRLLCAWLSAKVSQKLLMLVFSMGSTAFLGLMLLSGSVPMVSVAVAGLGFCMAGICPMIYADCSIFTNTYSMATGTLLAIGSIGAVTMPAIVGALSDRFGFTGGMSAIMIANVLLVLFALLNVAVKTRIPAEYQETVSESPSAMR